MIGKYLTCNSYLNPLYTRWKDMRRRCRDTKHPGYKNYGGKGVKVCAEWVDNYYQFRLWALSTGYEPGLSLERKFNDQDYSPENCHWIKRGEQLRNTSRNIPLTAFGETKLQKDWTKDPRCKPSETTFKSRIQQGWAVELALTTPAKRLGKGA